MANKSYTVQITDGVLYRVGSKRTRIASLDDRSPAWQNPDGMVPLQTTPCPACKVSHNHSYDYHRQFVSSREDERFLKYINTGSPWC